MNDRTIIRPGGGRRSRTLNTEANQATQLPKSKNNLASLAREKQKANRPVNAFFKKNLHLTQESEGVIQSNENPLISMFSPIILLVTKVKLASSELDLDELRNKAIEQIEYYRDFNFGMESNFSASEEVSYGLCSFLDEMVLNTPWGAKSNWASNSLLVTFHKEAWGGERFFSYLEKMSLAPAQNIDVIELYYVFLELGFEGKYRQSNDGMRAQQTIKNNTYLLLEKYKALEPLPLSTKWQGTAVSENSLFKVLPQWVLWAITIAILISVYFTFNLLLSNQSDPIKRQLISLQTIGEIKIASHNTNFNQARNVKQIDLKDNNSSIYPMLQSSFRTEISDGSLIIEQQQKGVSIRLTNANLFNSGSDELATKYADLVNKIGKTLSNHNVRINVSGHSDDIPIRTIKYPDNWALSQARANTVKNILTPYITRSSQIFARGLADTINLVPNTNATNRSINRRVELLIRS